MLSVVLPAAAAFLSTLHVLFLDDGEGMRDVLTVGALYAGIGGARVAAAVSTGHSLVVARTLCSAACMSVALVALLTLYPALTSSLALTVRSAVPPTTSALVRAPVRGAADAASVLAVISHVLDDPASVQRFLAQLVARHLGPILAWNNALLLSAVAVAVDLYGELLDRIMTVLSALGSAAALVSSLVNFVGAWKYNLTALARFVVERFGGNTGALQAAATDAAATVLRDRIREVTAPEHMHEALARMLLVK